MRKRKIAAPQSVDTPSPSTEPGAQTTLPIVEASAISPPAAEATAEPRIEATQIDAPKIELPKQPVAGEPAPIAGADAKQDLWHYAPLAASLTLAAALGALAGASVASSLAPPPLAPAIQTIANEDTIALKNTVMQLGRELASVKASVDTAARSSAAQTSALADRFDRAEKAQEKAQEKTMVEPVAKIAKIIESLDRLERRAAAASAPDVTGSVTKVEKQQPRPIEGWELLDVYGGRAVLQSRAGDIYEVHPGSSIPGVGKVEEIKRENGRVLVVTPNGTIAAAIEQRRPQQQPYYSPYRHY